MSFKGSAEFVKASFQDAYWAVNSSLTKNF
jgi:hypothetical protein